MQEELPSVADDQDMFHNVLGQVGTSAENKLKAVSAGPNDKVHSMFDSMYMSHFHAVLEFSEGKQRYTTGFTQVAAGTWGHAVSSQMLYVENHLM